MLRHASLYKGVERSGWADNSMAGPSTLVVKLPLKYSKFTPPITARMIWFFEPHSMDGRMSDTVMHDTTCHTRTPRPTHTKKVCSN